MKPVLLLLALACGCASTPRSAAGFPPAWIIYPAEEGGESVRMEEWIAEHPMPPDAEISIHDVSRGESASSHIVQIRNQETPHVHEHHDLVVIVQKGHGVLRMGSRAMNLVPGSVVAIPRGVPHSFVNGSDEPAVAFVVFTPAFDGTDTVPLPE